ncbi:MAG: hypothetical protein ACFFC6_15240 [Promethearchaeota archaeon]
MPRRARWLLDFALIELNIGLLVSLAEYFIRYTFQSSHSIHRVPKVGDSVIESGIFLIILFYTGIFDYAITKFKEKKEDDLVNNVNSSYNKWNRILLFSLIILVFVYGGCIINVPNYRTYSKFGFSFEHPEDMDVKFEVFKGRLSCNDIGLVSCKNDKEDLSVMWVSNPNFVSLDSLLNEFLNTVNKDFNIKYLGDRTDAYNGRNVVRYQRFYVEDENTYLYSTYGVMNNIDHNRIYLIIYINDVEKNIDTFIHCVESMTFFPY